MDYEIEFKNIDFVVTKLLVQFDDDDSLEFTWHWDEIAWSAYQIVLFCHNENDNNTMTFNMNHDNI